MRTCLSRSTRISVFIFNANSCVFDNNCSLYKSDKTIWMLHGKFAVKVNRKCVENPLLEAYYV